jgi:GT2 family glycosyltransferase
VTNVEEALGPCIRRWAPVTGVVGVLTWRGEGATRRFVASAISAGIPPRSILVVDNASGTGEGERISAAFGVWSIVTDRNGGVASGYNAALRWAAARGLDYALLMNNDTIINEPAFLSVLAHDIPSDVAAIGPLVREENGRLWSAGGRLNRWLGHASHRRDIPAERREVDWIDGSAMLVNLIAAGQSGGFSEDYFLYWEETDWCTRVRARGYRILVEPGAQIIHKRGGTVAPLVTRQHALRNSLLFVRRNLRGLPAATSIVAWTTLRVPIFVIRVGWVHGLGLAIRSVVQILRWHEADIRSRGWALPAVGPRVAPDEPSPRVA